MHYYAEVHPRISGNLAFIKGLGAYDGFNIPDSPLGEPAPLPLAAACLIRRIHDDKRIMVNQRLLDVNELHLVSIAQGTLMLNADLVLTRGDKPKIGKEVGYLTSEEALRLLKSRVKGVRVGLMLSMRYGKELIENRMRSGADFYLVLRLSNPVELRGLDTSRLIPYVLIETERNSKVINRINQPHFKLSELGDLLNGLRGIGVEGVLLSVPGDYESLINLTRYFI
ncbi:hypothetical protein [Caldivirga maquilingensis]|nr:hypothetical protein [Caldivirga maquilingensis]